MRITHSMQQQTPGGQAATGTAEHPRRTARSTTAEPTRIPGGRRGGCRSQQSPPRAMAEIRSGFRRGALHLPRGGGLRAVGVLNIPCTQGQLAKAVYVDVACGRIRTHRPLPARAATSQPTGCTTSQRTRAPRDLTPLSFSLAYPEYYNPVAVNRSTLAILMYLQTKHQTRPGWGYRLLLDASSFMHASKSKCPPRLVFHVL